MTRSATPAALAALEAEHVAMLAFVEMQFASGTVRVCNAFESVPWNGFTWLGLGNLGTIEPIEENTDLGMSGIGLQLSGVNPALIATALGEQYQGRRCNIWLAPLGVDDLATLEFDFAGTRSLVPRFGSATVTFTRSGATATRVNASGLIETVAADTPRFDFDPVTLACKGLLIEEARTNSGSNGDMTGAVAGTPGTMPTGWGESGTGLGGLTRTIVGSGTENGVPYVEIRYAGTSVGGVINIHKSNAIAASTGQVWSLSAYLRLVGGSLANLSSWTLRVDEGNPGFLRSTSVGNIGAPTSDPLIRQRKSGSLTIGASTTQISTHYLQVNAAAGAVDFTIRFGGFQIELGAFPTSYIPTTTAAATRNADSALISSIGAFYNASEGAMAIEAISHPLQTTANQYVAEFSDGTSNERILLYRQGTGATMFVRDGAVTQVQSSLGTWDGGVQTRLSFGFKLNDFAGSKDGAAVVTDTSGTMPTVDRIRFGGNVSNTENLNGHLRRFTYYAKRLTNEQLVARSADGPSGYGIVADPIGPFRFRMDTMSIDKGKTATITLTAENRLADWDRARIRRYTDEDQKADHPTDRFFEFIPELQEKEIIF